MKGQYMGHGPFGHGSDSGHPGFGTFKRLPRGLRIGLAIGAVFILLFVLLTGLAIVLLVIRLLLGGDLPGLLQSLLDFVQRNFEPLINLWNNLQGIIGN